MPNENTTVGTSPVTTNEGKVIQLANLVVPANQVYGFVEMNREAYFEDHSLEWALEQIISRGKAEITRAIKAGEMRAQQKAAGDILKEFKLTPEQAKALLAKLAADATASAKQAAK